MNTRTAEHYGPLADLLAGGDVVVLSGAGLSTESGIPDYRGPSGALRRHTPMTYQTFVSDAVARRRYWARSHLGWRTVTGATPNAGHRAVAELDRLGLLAGVLTQNVDGLHQAGGARSVVELHGSLARVTCLGCGGSTDREMLDHRLRAANPRFTARYDTVNPDGDVELPDEAVADFRTVDCQACPGGMLKPDVVFFGESVPADRVQTCFDLVERARLLLVLGSSLTVMSGRRFVVRAARLDIPVVIINQGPTRGDDYASLTVDAPLGVVLPELVRLVAPARSSDPSGHHPPAHGHRSTRSSPPAGGHRSGQPTAA
ncbi:NAD-dependent protein deacetylase [Plantactinospora soyae]|uniref:NAD-dependent protein deacetylase n=1 Tax=Plantactinospora soyae TaxID=1544732 RepID=A0A927MAD0_9ACTN|nr:NAD-dependent protein deacetylase [Plantactinospora soyae]MBE1487420.1 NAD-dependent SIR2 family protein deacetylase [Plantactinospora soyae]